ncbi:4-(cytidine 5'-diphospho)-2-C-methyl-D-erythritol kinase [Ventosimonas gracilis]|uniref:4-(cytidine 5'-diphospho)-2-C-methyl-D-erythritol kinase n=1 Tax=Ventosimonas gracilis TaxID=1680762 RepID=UPI000AE0AD00|nr:4-(cytidine 5'-diphospho)-2-C-methyl-D-erythritol kinase [Ventosimonas gracilis]
MLCIPAQAELVLPAPAKLNLFLHVIGQREDGYHHLQTLFQFLDYSDEIGLACRQDGQIILHTPLAGVEGKDNLLVRAAKRLQEQSGCRLGADLWLNKRLPQGAGLGGGSSDAATVLQGLNRLWQLNLSSEQLAALGLQLGADVPVFIHGKAALAFGVGEQLQPVDLPEPWFVVAVPPVSISTAAVFSDPNLRRNSPKLSADQLLSMPWRNDCEPVVLARYPQVRRALAMLPAQAEFRLTGTGACLFSGFAKKEDADRMLRLFAVELKGFVAKGLNRSPLHHRLKAKGA